MVFAVLLSKWQHSLGKFFCASFHTLKGILAPKLGIQLFLSDATWFRLSRVKQ